MKRIQQGFTLIELMIVVAIIGILAAIAIPAYQDYIVRSKMTEAITAAAPAKTSVSEFFMSENVLPSTLASAGFSGNIDSKYVQSVTWDGSEIGVKIYGSEVGGGFADGDEAVVLSPLTSDSRVDWRCKHGSAVSDAELKYLPATCRN